MGKTIKEKFEKTKKLWWEKLDNRKILKTKGEKNDN